MAAEPHACMYIRATLTNVSVPPLYATYRYLRHLCIYIYICGDMCIAVGVVTYRLVYTHCLLLVVLWCKRRFAVLASLYPARQSIRNQLYLPLSCLPFLSLFGCVYSPGAHAMPIVVVRFDSPCLLWVFLNVYATVLFSGSCTIKTPCPAVAQWQPQAVIVHHGPRDDHFTGPGGFRVALTN